MRHVLLAIFALSALACANDDDDGSGPTTDTGTRTDTGQVDVGTDTGQPIPQQLLGTWEIVAMTVDGIPLTTENQDFDGVQVRLDGTIEILAAGRYTLMLTIYQDDVAGDSLNSQGDVTIESDNVVVIQDDNEDVATRFNYVVSGDTLEMTVLDEDEGISSISLRRRS